MTGFTKYRGMIVAITLFLLTVATLVGTNLYIANDLDQDAVGINLSGRQRMLSQDQLMALRIDSLLSVGGITKSARVLDAAPLADARAPNVIAALREKHPNAEPPELLQDDTPPLRIDADILQRTLLRLEAKRGSAGGPTGMTYEHVLAATKTSSDAFNATLAFVNHMLSGKMPRHPSLLVLRVC